MSTVTVWTRDTVIAHIEQARANDEHPELSDAELSDAELRGGNLTGADVTGADVTGWNLYDADGV